MYSIALRNATIHGLQRTVLPVCAITAARIIGARLSSTMHDNDPELLEKEKQRNLSQTQRRTSTPFEDDGAPGWNESLASASEASVKADKSTISKDKLQQRTVDYIQARHSPEDKASSRQASYSHDTVDGPLSGAGQSSPADTVVKKTSSSVKKDTTEYYVPTPSEEAVKADRGEAAPVNVSGKPVA